MKQKNNHTITLEADIKATLLNHLREKKIINNDTIIISELAIANHVRRADLVILSKGKIIAFEIKSEADSLTRLKGQLTTFTSYFDKVIVVAAPKYASKIAKTTSPSIGVWEINGDKIKTIAKGKLSKRIEGKFLINYLDYVDLKKLSTRLQIKPNLPKSMLKNELLPYLSNKVLRESVTSSLYRKFFEANSLFFEKTNNKVITPKDIKLLSRFLRERELYKNNLAKANIFWSNIGKHADEFVNLLQTDNTL